MSDVWILKADVSRKEATLGSRDTHARGCTRGLTGMREAGFACAQPPARRKTRAQSPAHGPVAP